MTFTDESRYAAQQQWQQRLVRTGRRSTPLLFAVLVLGLLGSFSLDRLGTQETAAHVLPIVLEPRYLGFLLLWCWSMAYRSVDRIELGPATRRYIRAVFLAFGFLAISSVWRGGASDSTRRLSDILDVMLVPGLVWISAIASAKAGPRGVYFVYRFFVVVAGLYLVGGLLGVGNTSGDRLSAFTGGPNVFVRIMMLGALSALFLYLDRRQRLMLALIPAFLIGALLSGSRGGLLSLILVGIITGWPVLRRIGHRKAVRAVTAIVVACGIALILFGPNIAAFVQDRYIQLTVEQGYSADRSSLFSASIHEWIAHPLLGIGLGGFRYRYFASTTWEYPHNVLLSFGVESGIVGFLFCMRPVRRGFEVFRANRRRMDGLGLGVLGASILFASLFSGSYFDSRFAWMLFVMALVASDRDCPEPAE